MSARLYWQVGNPEDADAVVAGTTPAVLPRRVRRLELTPALLGFYCVALILAGLLGFGLGRWAEGQNLLQAGVGRAVGLEVAAWRSADPELLAGSLAAAADPQWRRRQLRQLRRSAPAPHYSAELRSVRLRPDGLAAARVQVGGDGGLREEERLYAAADGGWYRLR
jgi:hypothetical protein